MRNKFYTNFVIEIWYKVEIIISLEFLKFQRTKNIIPSPTRISKQNFHLAERKFFASNHRCLNRLIAAYFITAISPFTIRSLFMTCKFPGRRHERIVSSFCGKGNKCLQISSDFVLFWPRGNFLFAAFRHHPPQHFFPTHQVTFFAADIWVVWTWSMCFASVERFI